MADARTLRGGGVALGLLLLTAPLAFAQKSVPTFGVDVEVVSLSLAVTDPRGGSIDDLREQDVVVWEDGVRQPVQLFTRETWPITVDILIDGSDSMTRVLPLAQSAARRLVAALGPGDRASVGCFTRRLEVLQDLTSDRARLDDAIDAVRPDGVTALYDSLYVALKDVAGRRRDGRMERRALVVLTDGSDTASITRDEEVLEVARRAEVAIYAVGLRDSRPPRHSEDTVPTYFLTALARETGGRAFFPTAAAELEGTYDRIAEELRSLYGVAYTPVNPSRDGLWRRIRVQSLRPNLLLRHRTGYYAPTAARVAASR